MFTPKRYRKKPVVISAVQLTLENAEDVAQWSHADYEYKADDVAGTFLFKIHTLEGDMFADMGDWIIEGVAGEHYPCKPQIFEASYEEA